MEKVKCPKCKGHKYFKGQSHIPNYKFNKNGICFTCSGTGESYLVDGEYITYHYSAGWIKCDDKGGFIERAIGPRNVDEVKDNFQDIIESEEIYELPYEYKKEHILEVENKYSEILYDIKIKKPIDYIIDKVCNLYNFEEAAIGLTNWKSDKKLVREYLEKLIENQLEVELQLGITSCLPDEYKEILETISIDTSKKIISILEEGLV